MAALPIDLDRAARTPLATQIYRAVRDAIETGRLDPGAKLPSWRDMAAQLGVSRGTVRVAYQPHGRAGRGRRRRGRHPRREVAQSPAEPGFFVHPFQAGAFVRHTMGSAYLTAAAAYGWQGVTTDRVVTLAGADKLQAKFNANSFSGRIEGGNRYLMSWLGGVGVTPYAAAQVTSFDLPAYAERAVSGASTFALAYAANSVTATRSELGLRTDKSFALTDSMLTLRGRAAWAHDFNPDHAAAATFQSLPGASFVVNGAAQASNTGLVTAAAEMKWLNGFSLGATFEGEFSDVTRSYAGKGVVRYAW